MQNKQIHSSCMIKINIQKSVLFLYINNNIWGKEIKKAIHLQLKPEHINLGKSLTKKMKDHYTEHYKTLTKKKQKYILCSWIGRIYTIKMSIPPKAVHRFSAMPIKFSTTFQYNQKKQGGPPCWVGD